MKCQKLFDICKCQTMWLSKHKRILGTGAISKLQFTPFNRNFYNLNDSLLKAQQLIDCSHWKARSKGKLWFKVCRRLRGTFLCQQPRLRILNWKTNPIHVVCFNTSRSQWRCVILTRSCNLQDGSFCHIYIFCFLNIH